MPEGRGISRRLKMIPLGDGRVFLGKELPSPDQESKLGRFPRADIEHPWDGASNKARAAG